MLDKILQALGEGLGLIKRLDDYTQEDFALAGPAEEAAE